MIDDFQQQDEGGAVQEDTQQDLLVDILSGRERKPTDKEQILQRMIRVLAAEYHFPLEAMERDVAVTVYADGKSSKKSADLVVYQGL